MKSILPKRVYTPRTTEDVLKEARTLCKKLDATLETYSDVGAGDSEPYSNIRETIRHSLSDCQYSPPKGKNPWELFDSHFQFDEATGEITKRVGELVEFLLNSPRRDTAAVDSILGEYSFKR